MDEVGIKSRLYEIGEKDKEVWAEIERRLAAIREAAKIVENSGSTTYYYDLSRAMLQLKEHSTSADTLLERYAELQREKSGLMKKLQQITGGCKC